MVPHRSFQSALRSWGRLHVLRHLPSDRLLSHMWLCTCRVLRPVPRRSPKGGCVCIGREGVQVRGTGQMASHTRSHTFCGSHPPHLPLSPPSTPPPPLVLLLQLFPLPSGAAGGNTVLQAGPMQSWGAGGEQESHTQGGISWELVTRCRAPPCSCYDS